MKGVKTMSVATATAKKFQADDIITTRVHLPGGVELNNELSKMREENMKLNELVLELTNKIKELEDKYDSLETD